MLCAEERCSVPSFFLLRLRGLFIPLLWIFGTIVDRLKEI